MMTPTEYDVHSLNKAMKGSKSDSVTFADIICSKSGPELDEIKKAYKKGKH